MYVQRQEEMMEFTYSDVLHNLSKIWTYNRLKEDKYYIAVDAWRDRFDAVLDAAEEIAREACMNNECRGWSGEYDTELLWQETAAILGFTYLESEAEIDR